MESFLRNIVEFITILRAAGIRISQSESIDAMEALIYVDLLDRNEVRAALSACLAKSEADRKVFNEAFDRYFIAVEKRKETIQSAIRDREQRKHEIDEMAQELKFRDEQIELEEPLKEIYASLPEMEKQSIREFLDKTSTGKNVRSEFKTIAGSMVQSKLKSLKGKYPESPGVPELPANISAEAGIMAGDVIQALKNEEELLHKNLGDILDKEIPDVIRIIEEMTQQLIRNMVQQKRITSRKASLDFRRTIRSGLSTGGVPFRLKYRKRSQPRYRVLLLCDVSASMHRFSGFVLQFISGMHSAMLKSDCYIFSQEVERIDMNGFGNALKFEKQVTESSVWRKGTDISRALWHILHESREVLNSSVIAIIVSDARTIHADRSIELLKAMSQTTRQIVWLNPVPEREWAGIPSVEKFRELCEMLDCSTLDKLRNAVVKFNLR